MTAQSLVYYGVGRGGVCALDPDGKDNNVLNVRLSHREQVVEYFCRARGSLFNAPEFVCNAD
jgi:hypothetical protein